MKTGCLVLILVGIMATLGCLANPIPEQGVSAGITNYPRNSEVGKPITIRWWISYLRNMELTHSAIHYGYFSHPGQLGFDVSSNETEYPGVVEVFPEQLRTDDKNFEVTLVPHQKGTLYFRVHEIIDGNNYWSEELSIQIE